MELRRGCGLVLLWLVAGCASVAPPRGREVNLRHTPRVSRSTWAHPPGDGTGPSSWEVEGPERQSATRARQAVLSALRDSSEALLAITAALPKLAAHRPGLGGANGVFTRYTDYGSQQLPWLRGALGRVNTLALTSSDLEEPQMEVAVLRLSGPRLQAALSATLLLAAWLDFLNLADAVLCQCPFYSVERLFIDLDRVHKLLQPSMAALASQAPAQVEAAALALPELLSQLTHEFQALRDRARTATERGGQIMAAAQLVEMLTLASTLKLSLPRLPPSAPALVGAELMMTSGGVVMGSQLVVSAEWVEMMRRLVQAGVLSLPAVSAAVRIHAGQVLMAQATGDLPQGVRDALGDGPEVGAMRETGKAGAGMANKPQHHVLPQEQREWFEKRGFTGDMDIDQFCVQMDEADHQAIHGGGNWRKGRQWPGEWNQMIMEALRKAESRAGRMLTRSEILEAVAYQMKRYNLPMDFTSWRGQ